MRIYLNEDEVEYLEHVIGYDATVRGENIATEGVGNCELDETDYREQELRYLRIAQSFLRKLRRK